MKWDRGQRQFYVQLPNGKLCHVFGSLKRDQSKKAATICRREKSIHGVRDKQFGKRLKHPVNVSVFCFYLQELFFLTKLLSAFHSNVCILSL